MTFRTVFDLGQQGYAAWWFPAHGLIFVGLGLLALFGPELIERLLPIRGPTILDGARLLSFGWHGRRRKLFGWCFLSFAVLWTAVSFATTYGQYLQARNALWDGRYQVVEGPVTDVVPPRSGRADESFIVNGIRFAYSDDVVTSGFHNAASRGGPIRAGLPVRVSYAGDLILRLEVGE